LFAQNYTLRYGDYKDFESVKPSALLDVIQDVAIRNSEHCEYGLYKMRELNMAWLMQGINLHIDHLPHPARELTVKTAVREMKGALSDRGTIIEQDGQVCAKAVAAWFLFDGNRMRPVRIPEDMAAHYEKHNFDDDFFFYKKPSIYDASALYTVRVGGGHIDTNNHLNNQKSAEMLIDALPKDFAFSDMSILYKKAAYFGDILTVCRAEIENGYFLKLVNKDGELCVAATAENK
jgi:acyl-ACP thioesterase